jgi:adenosylhomocysteine nucleosidase
MLAVFGALEEEISGLRTSMVIENIDTMDGGRVYRGTYKGRHLLLVNSGVGKRRALSACRSVIDRYPVTAIVSLGFAGALKPDCKTGDMFVCSSMVYAENPSAVRHQTDSRLLSIAQTCELKCLYSGVGVTSNRLVSSPSAKRNLREASEADIVDMESYWIAQIARENGIPFIIGRAVSDADRDTFPNLPSYEWRNAAKYFIWHPAQAWYLYRGMKRARRSLTTFATHMVEVIG